MGRDPLAAVWRELLLDAFSTLGRMEAAAICIERQSGRYQHRKLAELFGEEEIHPAIKIAHELLWAGWLRGSLEQQEPDLLLYLHDSPEGFKNALRSRPNSRAFLGLIPASAHEAERNLFTANLESLLALLRNRYGIEAQPSANGACRDVRISDVRVSTALQALELRLADPELSLGDIAKSLNVSGEHFGRLFKRYTGLAFREYLRNLRIKKGADLLLHCGDGIKTIAAAVGYADSSHFGKDFRARMGLTPREFRLRSVSENTKLPD